MSARLSSAKIPFCLRERRAISGKYSFVVLIDNCSPVKLSKVFPSLKRFKDAQKILKTRVGYDQEKVYLIRF